MIELLHLDVLQRHWRFRGDDVEDYAQLFQQAGVQGARDAGHRQQINQAGGDARTWKARTGTTRIGPHASQRV